MLEHKTDLVIKIGDLKDSNLHARLLGKSTLHLLTSPQYLAQHEAISHIDDLMQPKLLGFNEASKLKNWPLAMSIALSFHMTASSGEAVRQFCLAHQGITLLSNFMIGADLDSGCLIEVLPQAIVRPNHRKSVQAVYYINRAVSSRIMAFLDFIQPRLTL